MRRAAALALLAVFVAGCNTATPTATTSPVAKKRTIDAAAVREAYAKRPTYTYKVSYSISGSFGKEAVGGRMVAYQVPPRRRIDTTLASATQNQAFTLYIDETSIVACTLPLVPPCEPVTADEAANAGLGVALLDAPILENPQILDKAELSEDRIAGQPVTCFLIRQPGTSKVQAGSSLNACYTVEGILMRYGISTPDFDVELDGVLLLRDFAVDDVKLPQNAFLR